MAFCANCGTGLQDGVRFCPTCGASATGSDDMATMDFAPSTPRSARSASGGSSGSGSASSSRPPSSSAYGLGEGRFLPGRLLAGRYRIIALLGKGGMGEVYRADDLTLGQAVALKFLPDEAARDEGLLERFRTEVRVARRVSHPNVCRVYDVGDIEGQTFFTMEYIDGEDLASLLRRIGRLPPDKALDIARQLCAGLSAAHTKGVLHRDLKPANIMLDGRGQVVITDFGLAGLADDIRGAEIRSGTPAYMAPEQLAGKEVSVRSDIYALGLVLYEVFTGKRAFAESAPGRRAAEDQHPSRPSSVVKDLDPIVERVILRCLETEPSARPATVLSVAAAMPGGDPLAAALAAGETPSPQLVAAAGETAGLRPRFAVISLAIVLLGLALTVYLTIRTNPLDQMHVEQSPEVLRQRARDIIARLGYDTHPADSAFGFDTNHTFLDYVEKNDKPSPRWDDVVSQRPSFLQYWYRQSPRFMGAAQFHDVMLTPGIIAGDDPPTIQSGMVNLELDAHGRLTYFQAIAPQVDESAASSPTFDWNSLFALAGLDPAQFQPASPNWNGLGGADTRVAWTGVWPGTTRSLRVEAASWHGKPVFFSLIGPWVKPERQNAEENSTSKKIAQVLQVFLVLGMLFSAQYLARRNYRHGRGDREGAFRLACVMFGLEILLWLCRSHLGANIETFGWGFIAISTGLFISGLTWLLYLALEPWVRRNWPQTIISWSRLLSGRGRDPLVGRDLLFGVILGVVWILIFQLQTLILTRMGASPPLFSTEYLTGARAALGAWLYQVPNSILGALEFFFALLGLKVLLRKEWLAAIFFVAIFTGLNSLNITHASVKVPFHILVYTVAVVIVLRFGLVPLVTAIFTVDMLANVPFSADTSTWYMTNSIFALLSVVAIAGWGFYHSLGGETIWRGEPE